MERWGSQVLRNQKPYGDCLSGVGWGEFGSMTFLN